MIHFVFSDKDQRYLFLKGDNQVDDACLENMQKYVNLVDPICYLPTYKGIPFTQDFLWSYVQPSTGKKIYYAAIGMWHVFYKYMNSMNWQFDGLDQNRFKRQPIHTFEQFKEIVDSWGLKYTPRPYQYEAAYKILQWKQSLSQLATRAGKTLLAYIVFRYAMEYLGVKKILMIVPSIDLVKQAYTDFNEYAEFFKTECIWSGGKLVESANITVGTYQSLIKFIDKKAKQYNPSFFDNYDMIFVDEVHRATAFQIKTLISQEFMKNVKITFGMTGTLPSEHSIPRYVLHSLMGAKIQQISPIELIEQGYISPIKIYQHRITYKDKQKQLDTWLKCAEYSLSVYEDVKVTIPGRIPKEPKKKRTETDEQFANRYSEYVTKLAQIKDKVVTKHVELENPEFLIKYKKTLPEGITLIKDQVLRGDINILDYKKTLNTIIKETPGANMLHIEIMMNHFFEERIDYLIDILKQCPNNTLVLAQHREYIKHVYDRVKEAFPDRPVMYVIGGSKDRKTCKQTLKDNDNAILIAGYGIMSTGITLNNLAFGVLFESFKSETVNMQSLGRGLGLSKPEGISQYTLHDITDVYNREYVSQKILQQGKERVKIFETEKFPYEIITKTL